MDALIQLSDRCFAQFINLVHAYTKIQIAANRKTMIESRLRKRVMQLELTGYEDYIVYLKEHNEEKEIFINLVTTNETYFFRTTRIWDYIEHKFLAHWHADHPQEILRIWSGASSSGEEACSLGVLCEEFKSKNPGFNYQILGTDISSEMVESCKRGVYFGRSIDGFKTRNPALFMKYMNERPDGKYEVIPKIRAQLKFHQHNLFEPLKSINKFDLVLIRNVLIYFAAGDQEKLLSNVSCSLKKDGILIIGESESLSNINTPFKMIEPLIYSQQANTLPHSPLS